MLKEIERERLRTPRTLNEAFGPGSKLTVESPRRVLRDRILAFAWFSLIGAGWYLVVAIKAGPQ